MLVRRYQPWIWKLLFPTVPFKGQAFSWGNTIYTEKLLSPDLMEHEKVHLYQQRYSKFFGFFCILRYKWSTSYRRKCEIEAYAAQARFLKEKGEPWQHLAEHLGSPMYGVMTPNEARAVLHLKLQ